MELTQSIKYCARGDILSTNVDAVRHEFEKLLGTSERPCVIDLDLTACRMIDSVGLNFIVTLIRRAKGFGGATRILVGHGTVRRMMAFTRIDQHADVVMA